MSSKEEMPEKEEGATMLEYSLLVAIIASALISIVTFFMQDVSSSFSKLGSIIN